MKTLTNKQQEKLTKAFESICNLSLATEKHNFSTCSSYHIELFNTHWDKKTVKEVINNVKLYIDTWIIPRMEKALIISKKKVEKYEWQRHYEK